MPSCHAMWPARRSSKLINPVEPPCGACRHSTSLLPESKGQKRGTSKRRPDSWSAEDQDAFRDAAICHAQKLIEESALSECNLDLARDQTTLIVSGCMSSSTGGFGRMGVTSCDW